MGVQNFGSRSNFRINEFENSTSQLENFSLLYNCVPFHLNDVLVCGVISCMSLFGYENDFLKKIQYVGESFLQWFDILF